MEYFCALFFFFLYYAFRTVFCTPSRPLSRVCRFPPPSFPPPPPPGRAMLAGASSSSPPPPKDDNGAAVWSKEFEHLRAEDSAVSWAQGSIADLVYQRVGGGEGRIPHSLTSSIAHGISLAFPPPESPHLSSHAHEGRNPLPHTRLLRTRKKNCGSRFPVCDPSLVGVLSSSARSGLCQLPFLCFFFPPSGS